MGRVLVFWAASSLVLLCWFGAARPAPTGPKADIVWPAAAAEQTQGAEKIAPQVSTAIAGLKPEEQITVIVTLTEQADLRTPPGLTRTERLQRVIRALQAQAATSQRALRPLLEAHLALGRISQVTYFWIFNGLAVTATPEVVLELAERPEVLSITANVTIPGPGHPAEQAQSTLAGNEPNLGVINAPALWALGFRGQGAVVANMDTGVSLNHPDLVAQWRGGTNSWFDPHGEHPDTPTDFHRHGTWTMGVMVGRDASGVAIGVAPQAQWIAVKIFNDNNEATTFAIHQGFQWLLDPDGNPATPDAPQVVNNSWVIGTTPGCDLSFQPDVQALRAAGIASVFAAGNFGPNPSTSASPANYPEAFAVGATDNGDGMYLYSSRGPSACGEASTTFPEIVAPGVNIRTAGLSGTYYDATGTSLAAPHVAGALALLWSAYPNLTVAEQEALLINSAVDRGPVGPDNDYGNGRLDVLAAYQSLSRFHVYLPIVVKAAP
ncbi:MAG: hypothetical protein CEE40_05520 [Chloroflexi bacterium B3_Chlor]|nr:MAG: hypothetical protein CEE40_05520 [Chloroflexi bacterium B3_Chlor]